MAATKIIISYRLDGWPCEIPWVGTPSDEQATWSAAAYWDLLAAFNGNAVQDMFIATVWPTRTYINFHFDEQEVAGAGPVIQYIIECADVVSDSSAAATIEAAASDASVYGGAGSLEDMFGVSLTFESVSIAFIGTDEV